MRLRARVRDRNRVRVRANIRVSVGVGVFSILSFSVLDSDFVIGIAFFKIMSFGIVTRNPKCLTNSRSLKTAAAGGRTMFCDYNYS